VEETISVPKMLLAPNKREAFNSSNFQKERANRIAHRNQRATIEIQPCVSSENKKREKGNLLRILNFPAYEKSSQRNSDYNHHGRAYDV
jgi:hypothetical protein